MYSRKSVGPRMKPWGTPTITGYSCEDFPTRTTWSRLLLRNGKIRPNLTWNSTRLEFVKKNSMPNPVKTFGYSKCYSSSSPRPVKISINSVRYNCQMICSWLRRPKTILGITEKPHFSKWSKILLFTSFSKTLLTTERRLTGW